MQPEYPGGYDTHLVHSHVFDKFSSYPRPFLWTLIFVPFGLPESMCGKVIEYEHRGREAECLLGHRAVRHEMGIHPEKTKHSGCRLPSNAIQQQPDILRNDHRTKSQNDVDPYLAASPLFHPSGERFILEFFVSNNVSCPEALEVFFNIGEVFPAEAWFGICSYVLRCTTHLFRMKLIVFNPRSLANVITACPTYIG